MTEDDVQHKLEELLEATFPETLTARPLDWRRRDLVVEWFDLAFDSTDSYPTEKLKQFVGGWSMSRNVPLTSEQLQQLKQILDYWDAWQFGTQRIEVCGFLS